MRISIIICLLVGTPLQAWAGEPEPASPPEDVDALDLELAPAPPSAEADDGVTVPATSDHRLEDATVVGQRRAEATSAAHYDLDIGRLRIIPRSSVAEQLMMAPGVLTTNHGGEGHAHETYMRGFASKEGQDIEFLVDGVPLNEVGNPHSHGYADLYFMPPELVQSVSITEGAFDPEQGDFSFAGTAEYRLGAEERGLRVSHGHGLWGSHRLFTSWAPPGEEDGTFAGFEYFTTDGYGVNRSAQRALALGRFSDDWGAQDFSYALTVFGYATRFDQPGVLRADDYEAGEVDFYDTYDPNQGGESTRLLTTFDLSAGPAHSRFEQVLFLGYRTMRLRTNFTGWISDTAVDESGAPRTTQRGDGLEMRYGVFTGGSRGHYRVSERLFGQEQSLSLGYALRFDHGDSSQLRLRSVTAIPYLQVFDNAFTVLNLAGWLRAQLRPLPWLAVRGGLRLDTFSFGVTDNNQPESDREGDRIGSQTSQSFGFALNPRITVDARLLEGLNLAASYGQATRSTDAAALSDNETAPFARAQELDVGLAYRYGDAGSDLSLSAQLSYSLTFVDKDLLFDETAGRNVLVGGSTRHALLMSGRLQFGEALDVLANVGLTQATLDDTGELLPYIPQLVARLDVATAGQLADWSLGGVPVTGRVGVGVTYVPGRPLPLQAFGDPMLLLNVGGQVRLWHLSLGLEIRNALDATYRQVEFNYASNFASPDAIASRVPQRHFVGGEPFYAMATLTWHLGELVEAAAAAGTEPPTAEATGLSRPPKESIQ